jgi:hypothetical protein
MTRDTALAGKRTANCQISPLSAAAFRQRPQNRTRPKKRDLSISRQQLAYLKCQLIARPASTPQALKNSCCWMVGDEELAFAREILTLDILARKPLRQIQQRKDCA